MDRQKSNTRNDGFTLIEAAVVVAIFGFIIASMLSIFEQSKRLRDREITHNNIATIEESLREYAISNNGYYPCPARPNIGVDDNATGNGFGVADCGTCAGNICTGSVPTRTVGISDAHMLDSYGNRFTYAVTRTFGIDSTPAPAAVPPIVGSLTVELGVGGGMDQTGVQFVIVSHGPDGSGSWTRSGIQNQNSNCAAATQGEDKENCDNDSTFRTTFLFSREDGAATQYDDSITWHNAYGENDKSCIYLRQTNCKSPWEEEVSLSVPIGPLSLSNNNNITDIDLSATGNHIIGFAANIENQNITTQHNPASGGRWNRTAPQKICCQGSF